jgi:hypothetical protein
LDFGIFTGTLRSEALSDSPGNEIKFYWRGRETGEGQSTFGPRNVMEIQFLNEKMFKGTIY